MIYIKKEKEIDIIREGGRRLAAILEALINETKPGVSTGSLEDLANRLIKTTGGSPAFKDYPMGDGIIFPSSLCVSINNEVVHGSALPSRLIKNGDIVDLDIGMEWPTTKELRANFSAPINSHSKDGGYFTDMCATVGVGKVSQEAKKLMNVTRQCLMEGIKQVKPGNKINDIARAVSSLAKKNGYGVVRDLVGHGVGYFAHEEPDVFNFEIRENSPENIVLKPGMVIAIEPMINIGDWRIKVAKNGYTILTADNSLSAHFEHTIAVTEDGFEILTDK
ncbi:MAG: type I methionyl aminopeptidase [Patescibacteria group bacterium]